MPGILVNYVVMLMDGKTPTDKSGMLLITFPDA